MREIILYHFLEVIQYLSIDLSLTLWEYPAIPRVFFASQNLETDIRHSQILLPCWLLKKSVYEVFIIFIDKELHPEIK